ncbi:MAG: efflux RND transporter periplasmic adaptor subunit [Ignavibacteriales bacterium]|nr:efflux RND transporter periplasmic adaptor subunit [Ignavibacteriales bacterium]
MKPFFPALMLAAFLSGCSNEHGEIITETGTLEATEVTISAQVNGTLRSVRAMEGSIVREGDTLAVIDDTEWKYQLQQAEANLKAVEAQYRLTLEGAREEDLIQADANYKSAKSDLQRMEELHKTRSVSEKQLEDARTRFTLAEQTFRKLKEGSRREEIALAGARREQAAAQAAQLRKKVRDCTLTAPTAGTIITRFVEPGELVGPGSAVVRIADLTSLTMKIYVSQTILPRVQLGQQASIAVDGFEDRSFEGVVIHISSTAEFTPKNIQTKEERVKLVFAVKLNVANPDGTLKAGLPADATLRLSGSQP